MTARHCCNGVVHLLRHASLLACLPEKLTSTGTATPLARTVMGVCRVPREMKTARRHKLKLTPAMCHPLSCTGATTLLCTWS